MSKKSYMSLLKEAIAEFDTSDTVEVKGPMLDPILSWDGDGELPIYKDAASILERYYFNENKEEAVHTLDEADYENDKGKPDKGPAMKNAKGAGTQQAGTSDSGMDKHEEEIAKEGEEVAVDEDTIEEKEWSGKDEPEAKEYTDESADLEMENAIIEKLIAEMEDDLDEAEVMSYTGDEPKVTMPKEKKATGPQQDTKGAGTEQAGTGNDDVQVPDRKDEHEKFVKPKRYNENEEIEAALAALEEELQLEQDDDEEMADDAAADADEDADKDLDVDKEMVKKEAASAVPGGPSPKKTGEDWEDDEGYYSETFDIYKEAIMEEDDMDDDDSDDDDAGEED